LRLVGAETLAEHQILRRLGGTKEPRREQAGAGFRHESEIDEGKFESRAWRGVDEIAVQEHRRADADRVSRHRRDERLWKFRERLDEAQRRKLLPRLRAAEEIIKVVAGGEGAAGA